MIQFYIAVIKKALNMTLSFLGLSSTSATLRAALLWMVSSLIVYVFFEKLFEARIELAISALLGLFMTAIVVFVISLVVSPVKIYEALSQENKDFSQAILSAISSESRIEDLSKIYYEGKEAYRIGFSDEESRELWVAKMETWENNAENYLKRWFGVTALHKFRDTGTGFHFTIESMGHDLSNEDRSLLAKYSSLIEHLNEIILYDSSKPEAALKTIYETNLSNSLSKTGVITRD